MHIESLKMFCDLAETESFTKTAQLNTVTQSAVSQQIGSLETHFSSQLIERSKKKFRLTREGQLLYEHGKRILHYHESLISRLREMENQVSGTIRLSTIYSIGLHELPLPLKKYLKIHPQVNVHVSYRRANQVYEDVRGNVSDVGLVAFPVKHAELETVSLRKDRLILICHPRHPFTKQKRIPIPSLAGQKVIGFEPDLPTRKAIDKILKDHGVQARYAMEFDNIETVKRAVEIDAGVSIVPLSTIAQEIANKSLALLEFEDGEYFRPIAAIYRRRKVLSPALKEFLATLRGN
jgi:LysR family transcriptional regulator, transcriptional activator of the cysJI operon